MPGSDDFSSGDTPTPVPTQPLWTTSYLPFSVTTTDDDYAEGRGATTSFASIHTAFPSPSSLLESSTPLTSTSLPSSRADVSVVSFRGGVSTTTIFSSYLSPTATAVAERKHHELGFPGGAGAGIAIGVLLLLVAAIWWSAWKCCGFCGRARRRGPHESPGGEVEQHSDTNMLWRGGNVSISAASTPALTSTTLNTALMANPQIPDAYAPPPSYDAIRHDTLVPAHAHHRIGGQGHGEDEEFNVVADGKMPLSEIPFEDVDIEALHRSESSSATPSISASRDLEEAHRRGYGDTTGHTNS